jgi:hypothetical protein
MRSVWRRWNLSEIELFKSTTWTGIPLLAKKRTTTRDHGLETAIRIMTGRTTEGVRFLKIDKGRGSKLGVQCGSHAYLFSKLTGDNGEVKSAFDACRLNRRPFHVLANIE